MPVWLFRPHPLTSQFGTGVWLQEALQEALLHFHKH